MRGPSLVIFDVDNTLADRDSTILYPDVQLWFKAHWGEHFIALATNQGGVGLRYWMERDGFGDPSKLPTESGLRQRFRTLLSGVPNSRSIQIHVCYAYQSKDSGKWSPTPPGRENSEKWNPANRKPAPGMLLGAMRSYGVSPEQTTMVGDSPEDREAATAAGVRFIHRDEFFKEGK